MDEGSRHRLEKRSAMRRTRVLLCDDTEDILLLLSMELGFHEDLEVVGAAHNGAQAIDLAARLQPDVVILDLAMPVVGGLEALPRILEVSSARVIVLSGLDATNVASKALELGAARYLEKDVDPDEIAAVIREVAASRESSGGGGKNEGSLSSLVVVVAEGEPDLRESIDVNLRRDGARVIAANDGEEALGIVAEVHPDLVVLDAGVAKLDAYEVCRRIRSEPATGSIPIVVLVDKAVAAERVTELAMGANDWLVKPFDPVELQMRLAAALRTAPETSALNPLTHLPGNVQVQRELERRTARSSPFALMYIDLDNFKAFNDYYGFLRGDEAIRLEATCATDAVRRHARDSFVGHVGGDDVIAIVDAPAAEPIARDIIAAWDRRVLPLYDPEDARRGYVEVSDRLGELRRYPISTISIGIATNTHRPLDSHWEASEIATEMKRFAKQDPGSSYAFDRRARGDRRRAPGAPPPGGERRRRVIRLE
jgi:DNA-binding response OmpR family regulator